MKALITGANGAVGSYMIDYILKEHPEVDLHTTARQDSTYAGHHMMDLRSHQVLNQMIQKQQFDCIFHFACDPDVRKSFEEPVAMLDNNILSTAHLFEAIRKHSPQTKIILASTAEVYGRCSDGKPVTELAPLDPDNPYAVSKVTQDLLARTYFNCCDYFPILIPKGKVYSLQLSPNKLLKLKQDSEGCYVMETLSQSEPLSMSKMPVKPTGLHGYTDEEEKHIT